MSYEEATTTLLSDINTASIDLHKDEPRKHLGASIIGHTCDARLWHEFRWLKQEQFDGRRLRLFNRGHREEPALIALLRKIGFDVKDRDENGNQFRISGVNGHFGGSPDGFALCPIQYNIDKPILLEFKTYNENQFRKLQTNKVRAHKPMHFAQMSCYGRAFETHIGLYIGVNKNTDEIYPEFVELDWKLADDMFRRASSIIHAQEQPMKISQNKTWFECRWCPGYSICHEDAKPEKNCRSCKYAEPILDGQWHCDNIYGITEPEKHTGNDGTIWPEIISTGCSLWSPIINGN